MRASRASGSFSVIRIGNSETRGVKKFLEEGDRERVWSRLRVDNEYEEVMHKGETERFTRIATKKGTNITRSGSKEWSEFMAYYSLSQDEKTLYNKVFIIAFDDYQIWNKYLSIVLILRN